MNEIKLLSESRAGFYGNGCLERINWFLLALAYLSLFALGLADTSRGPIFPDLLREFSLSDSSGSLFFFIAAGAGVFTNLMAFYWLERLGVFRSLQVFSALQVLGLLLIGISGEFVWLLLASAVFGVSLGGLGVAVNLSAAESVPEPKRLRSLSGLHCMYGISSLLAPLLVTWIYQGGIEWRGVFLILSLGPALVLLLSLRPDRQTNDMEFARRSLALERKGRQGRPWKSTLIFAAIIGFYVFAEVGLSSRLVLYARRDLGFEIEKANLLLSGFFLCLFLGRLLFAVVTFPFKERSILMISGVASLVCFSLGLTVNPLWLSVCGLTMSVFYPCTMAWIQSEMGRDSGFTTSWCVTFQSTGLMVMHFLIGWLSDLHGLGIALWAGPFCLIVVLFLVAIQAGRQVRASRKEAF